MNKNLKRALNTTAAVSMSLAMVLGAVAPVTNIAAAELSKEENKALAFNSAEAFVKAFVDINSDVKEIKLTDNVAIPKNYKDMTITLENVLDATIQKEKATANDVIGEDGDKFGNILRFYVDNFSIYGEKEDENYYDAALHLVGKATLDDKDRKDVVKMTNELKTFINTELKDWTEDSEISDFEKEEARFEEGKDYVDYVGNLADEALAEKFNDWYGKASEAENEYKDENNDTFVENYIDALEKAVVLTVKDGDKNVEITVRDLVEKEAEVYYKDVAKVESFLKALKADKKIDSELEYDDVKDEAEVAEMVEGLEAIVEEMKEVKYLLKTTTTEYKDYKKVEDKVETLVKAVVDGKVYDEKDNEWKKAENQEEAIDNAITAFRSSDVAKLKTYVEEVFNQFYTVIPRETSRGTYVLRLENADYGRYVVETDFDTNLRTLLTTPVDKTEGEESYYDLLVGNNATVDELYAAVTEDIEGLTLDSKITSTDAQKIIAAKKALDRLVGEDGELTAEGSKLTYKEQKEVKSNATLIRTLYLKLIINGEVTTIGWVETPQGWEYYDNNGKRVMEGWAPGNGYWSYMKNGYSVSNEWCAAKNNEWYYMGADGKMVTGIVTIDGVDYNFGTDGIWVR